MASAGNFKVAARRTALGDRNVASRDAGDALRDNKPGTTHNSNIASSIVISKAQENQKQTKPKDVPKNLPKKGFFQPAQRPLKHRTIAPSVSMSNIPTVAINIKEPRKVFSKSSLPWVYIDEREEESKLAPAEPARAAPKDRPVAQAPQVQPSTAKPNLKQEPVIDMAYLDPAIVQPEHHVSQSQQQNSTCSNIEPLLPIPLSDAPSPGSPRADDDITEPLYIDASEHFTQEQIQFITNAPAQFDDPPKSQQLPVCSRPEPLVPERIDPSRTSSAQPKVSSSNCNNRALPSSLLDNQAYPPYLSDSDEEDQYDDPGYTTAHSYAPRGDNTTGGVTTVMFPPRITNKGQAELEAARHIVESGRTAEEIQEDAWDVSMVAEYGDDIFRYMKEQEVRFSGTLECSNIY